MTARTAYRFAPRDRTGWVLGLSGPQVVVVGAALVAGVLLSSGAGLVAGAVPVAAAVAVAFGRAGGRPLLEAAPPAVAWALRAARHRNRWAPADAPPVPAGDGAGMELPLPPPLGGQRLLAVAASLYDPALDGDVAVVHDPATGSWAAALPVGAAPFALAEPSEQDRLLAGWGDALAGFCAEGGPVSSVRWLEWAAPGGLDDQLAYLAEHGRPGPPDAATSSYRRLLDRAGPMATRHQVLVTVTVDSSRVAARRRHRGDAAAAATEALVAQLRLFAARLEAAGLAPGRPLSPAGLEALVKARLDPVSSLPGGARPRSLAERAGHRPAPAALPWPASADARPGHVAVGRTLHRVFWVSEWPRLEVGAAWMSPLVLAAGAVRTLALVAEPVPPRRSRRAVERDATKLASDEEHRRSKGFRVPAHHRRAQADVEEREHQLVAGFGELSYAGLVAVAAADPDALERACDDLAQVAGGCGVELVPLDFRHGQGLGACLPLARALAPAGVR